MVGGGDPFYLKFWVNRSLFKRNRRYSVNIRLCMCTPVMPYRPAFSL